MSPMSAHRCVLSASLVHQRSCVCVSYLHYLNELTFYNQTLWAGELSSVQCCLACLLLHTNNAPVVLPGLLTLFQWRFGHVCILLLSLTPPTVHCTALFSLWQFHYWLAWENVSRCVVTSVTHTLLTSPACQKRYCHDLLGHHEFDKCQTFHDGVTHGTLLV